MMINHMIQLWWQNKLYNQFFFFKLEPMKHLESVTTNQTKTSLLHKSTVCSQNRPQVVVFLSHQFKRLQISVPLQDFTVKELTVKALEEFRDQYGVKVSQSGEKWELYASKKSSRAYTDYPSLEPTQKVCKTGFSYFFLCQEKEVDQSSSSSYSKIKTSFQEVHKKEIKAKENRSCLCFYF